MTPIQEAEFIDAAALGAPEQIAQSSWVVMKFGGTSVTGLQNWQTIAALIGNRHQSGLHTLVVHSALATVSDLLDQICQQQRCQKNLKEVIRLHQQQAQALGLNSTEILDREFEQLSSLCASAEKQSLNVKMIAELMSLGELMSTKLGVAYLQKQKIDTKWLDARDWLKTESSSNPTEHHLLNAHANYSPDRELQLALGDTQCIVTQGFIASNISANTTLLGRGGSDTSAAYFAAKIQARRLEIWTDVPGLFSANPRLVPSARSLKALHYSEAQEIAATGSTVLHPRCLVAPAQYGIPIQVRSTKRPDLDGTSISQLSPGRTASLKAISYRTGVNLISMENIAMWQEAGFLANAFEVFARHNISVDLISTSETNVTVSIDPLKNLISTESFERVKQDLSSLCNVTVVENCTSVSLVGHKIRTMLNMLAPAMDVFAEHKIHLVSQAANDLNFTVVVDNDQGERLVHKLHDTMIQQDAHHDTFGLPWTELHQPTIQTEHPKELRWWEQGAGELLELMDSHDSAYVYHTDTARLRARELRNISALDNTLYAMKANPNADLLRAVYEEGMSFECVSPGELKRLFKLFPKIDRQRILYTPNFASRADYQFGLDAGVRVTLDNLYPLRHWHAAFKGQQIFLRIDPGQGRGHHELVRTAGSHSKFGIPLFELNELEQLIDASGAEVVGIHAHSGSGIMNANSWHEVGLILSQTAQRFEQVQFIDVGGGLGVPEKPDDARLDLQQLATSLEALKARYPQYQLWMEPGRFIAAECGVLLAKVTQTKGKGDIQYVGVATGMNSLIRPALYGSYHEIVNLSRLDQRPSERYSVVGPNCETGDRLGLDRLLPICHEGDVLLIANTGAYGYAMSSHYNLREPAVEIAI